MGQKGLLHYTVNHCLPIINSLHGFQDAFSYRRALFKPSSFVRSFVLGIDLISFLSSSETGASYFFLSLGPDTDSHYDFYDYYHYDFTRSISSSGKPLLVRDSLFQCPNNPPIKHINLFTLVKTIYLPSRRDNHSWYVASIFHYSFKSVELPLTCLLLPDSWHTFTLSFESTTLNSLFWSIIPTLSVKLHVSYPMQRLCLTSPGNP